MGLFGSGRWAVRRVNAPILTANVGHDRFTPRPTHAIWVRSAFLREETFSRELVCLAAAAAATIDCAFFFHLITFPDAFRPDFF